jgi:hypothetical protein
MTTPFGVGAITIIRNWVMRLFQHQKAMFLFSLVRFRLQGFPEKSQPGCITHVFWQRMARCGVGEIMDTAQLELLVETKPIPYRYR